MRWRSCGSRLRPLRAFGVASRRPRGSPHPLTALEESLQALRGVFARAEEQSPLAQLAERAAEVAANLARVGAVDELDGARTLESGPRGFTLSLMPFDISQRFRALLEARAAAWTLPPRRCVSGRSGHFTAVWDLLMHRRCIDSPFDHERQSLL